jgi:beta-lactam-binding protein with PASTA domain
VYAWGHNFGGEIGNGTQHVQQLTPAHLNLSNVSQVALGNEGGLAVGRYDAAAVPGVVGFSQSEASAALQVAGFALARVGLVVDITCEFIGEVKTQTPAAGTLARLGMAVNATIGKPGGKCL